VVLVISAAILTLELLNAGYEIVVVDSFSNSKPEALKRVREITEKSKKCAEMLGDGNRIIQMGMKVHN
jgi:UDP-glucose 4-epimerase